MLQKKRGANGAQTVKVNNETKLFFSNLTKKYIFPIKVSPICLIVGITKDNVIFSTHFKKRIRIKGKYRYELASVRDIMKGFNTPPAPELSVSKLEVPPISITAVPPARKASTYSLSPIEDINTRVIAVKPKPETSKKTDTTNRPKPKQTVRENRINTAAKLSAPKQRLTQLKGDDKK